MPDYSALGAVIDESAGIQYADLGAVPDPPVTPNLAPAPQKEYADMGAMIDASTVPNYESLGAVPDTNMGLAERAGKQYLNKTVLDLVEESRPSTNVAKSASWVSSDSMQKLLSGLPSADASLWEQIKAMPKLWLGMTKAYYGLEGKDVQAKAGEELKKVRPSASYDVPAAKDISEKAVDIGAGLGAFMTQLFATKGLLPKGITLSEPVAWEIVNQANGGTPGLGALQAGAFKGISGIPAKTLIGKAGKLTAESGALAGLTAAQGGTPEDIAVSALIPPAMHAVGAVGKTAKKLISPSEKVQVNSTQEGSKIILTQPEDSIPIESKIPVSSDTNIPQSVPLDPVQKVTAALKEATPLRGQQEKIYSQERAKRFAAAERVGEQVTGEKGYYAELSKLKGELPKVQFESIRSKLTQGDIDSLFIKVKDSPHISELDKLSAREGLAKMFGEFGGNVPQRKQIELLNKVFGSEFTKEILNKRSLFQKAKDVGLDIANLPRSLMASFDLSAPLRQGVFFIGKPKQWIPAYGKMFKYAFSPKAYEELHKDIINRPSYKTMRESGLAITELGNPLGSREEAFMSTWAEKIPGIGIGVRASERAYLGFLNKLRADVFDDLMGKAERLGLKPGENPLLSKQIANFVNNGTGRGKLGPLESAAVPINSIFFSPRLMASRLTLLNPMYYVKQEPFVRKEALKSLLSFAGTGMTVLGLAKMAGMEVGVDPRSANFGKMKIGNTRFDMWGGFQQWVRLGAQLITGEYISSSGDKTIVLGEGYKPLTRLDIVQRAFEYKTAPIASFALSLLRGQTPFGEKISIPKEIGLRFTPMVIQDFYDLAQEDPRLLPAGIPGLFGVGVQTYNHPNRALPKHTKYKMRYKYK